MRSCFEEQLAQLKLIGEQLHYLHMHDAIIILRNSFSITKLQGILRTSLAFSTPSEILEPSYYGHVSRITNINSVQGDPSWHQTSLPVGTGGLGFRSASSLPQSAFLASSDGAPDIVQQLLPPQLSSVPYHVKDCALSTLKSALPEDAAVPTTTNWQKSWDQSFV